jgi:hypothetical protein
MRSSLGDAIEVVFAAVIVEQFEQPGDAARPGVRQHLVR